MFLDKKSTQWTILVIFWAIIYIGNIFTPAFFDDADTVHSEAVREMVLSGDWTTLKINNGIRYLEKAPLMYWLSAASVTVFGLYDWAVRLPVALFALFLTMLLYRFGNRFWGEKTGFFAALVYVTSLGPFAFTRIFLPDVILAFFMTSCLYFYLRVAYEPEPEQKLLGRWDWRCMAIYASAALAVLTKGLVGVIFVGIIILAHIILSGRWDLLRKLQIPSGIVVFLLIAAPWHIIAGFSNKGFFWFYFMNEHFLRYLGLRYPKDYDTVPLWLFWSLHLVWLFPWTIFSWGLVQRFPRRFRPESRSEQLTLFLYMWILLILLFFSFSTTQEYYTFPTLPAFALLFGQVLTRLDSPEGAREQRKALISAIVFITAGTIIAAALFTLAWMGKNTATPNDLTNTLTVNPEQYALSFGHIHDLTTATFGYLSGLVYMTGLIFLLGPIFVLISGIRKRWFIATVGMGIMMLGLLRLYNLGMVAFEPALSSKGLAQAIQAQYQPGDQVFINGIYERGSSINYYTGIQVSILNGHFGNLWNGSYYPDAPPIFYNDESFLALWNSQKRVYLFSEEIPLNTFLGRHPEFKYRILAKEGGKTVLVNW